MPAAVATFDVPTEWIAATTTRVREVAVAFDRGDVSGGLAALEGDTEPVRRWVERHRRAGATKFEVSFSAWFRQGDGFVANVVFAGRQDAGSTTYLDRAAWILPDGRIQLGLPADLASPRLVAQRADALLDVAAATLAVDTTVTVTTDGARIIPFTLALARDGFTITRIEQAGARCHYRVDEGHLLVEPVAPADTVTLRIRYAGPVADTHLDHIRIDDLVLRGEAGWLPIIPGSRAEFDVTVATAEPDGAYHLIGQGDQLAPRRWLLRAHEDFTLYGAKAYVQRTVELPGTRVVLSVWPMDAGRLDTLEQIVRASFASFAPLGAYPYREVRIVESDFYDGTGGYGALSAIALGWRLVQADPDPQFLAHELAHGWFGGVVPPDAGAMAGGQWNETLAEYVALWSMPAADAALARGAWAADYQSILEEDDDAILHVGSATVGFDAHHAIGYSKGALVLTALEARLGKDRVAAALRRFLDDRAGQPSNWSHLVAAVAATAGREHADWLHTWLSRRGAPDLRIRDHVIEAGVLRGVLTQTTAPPFTGTVELGWFDGPVPVGRVTVEFGAQPTPLTLAIPAAATHLQIDPDNRVPRRYPGLGHKARAGQVINVR